MTLRLVLRAGDGNHQKGAAYIKKLIEVEKWTINHFAEVFRCSMSDVRVLEGRLKMRFQRKCRVCSTSFDFDSMNSGKCKECRAPRKPRKIISFTKEFDQIRPLLKYTAMAFKNPPSKLKPYRSFNWLA